MLMLFGVCCLMDEWQETRKSGNKPNQRGKYVLIPNEVWSLFPHLTTTNLNDFNINLQENQKIWIVYHTAAQMASICMTGEIVTIDCISAR
jgi:hypothetical protein